MRMMMFGAVLIAGCATASTTMADATAPAADSETISCVSTYAIRDTDALSDQDILFRLKNGKSYRNHLSATCPRLKREDRFSYHVPGTQVCRGDMIQVLDISGRGWGTCSLGSFTRVEPAKGGN